MLKWPFWSCKISRFASCYFHHRKCHGPCSQEAEHGSRWFQKKESLPARAGNYYC